MRTTNIMRIKPKESQIQGSIVECANKTKIYENNNIGDFLIAIPNGGYRNRLEAQRLKIQGVKSGVSDLFLAIPRVATYPDKTYFYGGLWLELKSHNGKLSYNQAIWLARMQRGYVALVVYSVDEAIQSIKDYLGME